MLRQFQQILSFAILLNTVYGSLGEGKGAVTLTTNLTHRLVVVTNRVSGSGMRSLLLHAHVVTSLTGCGN
jgi:hypothetical protein